jgi:hypothetical protein
VDFWKDSEHAWIKDLTTIVGHWQSKESGTGDDTVEAGSLADILTSVLCLAHNSRGVRELKLELVLMAVLACPAEECKTGFM